MRPIKWERYTMTPEFMDAQYINVFGINGKQIDIKFEEQLDGYTVLKVKKYRNGVGDILLDVTVKQPRITYNDIYVRRDRYGNYVLSCIIANYSWERTYMFYTKRQAMKLFHEEANRIVKGR